MMSRMKQLLVMSNRSIGAAAACAALLFVGGCKKDAPDEEPAPTIVFKQGGVPGEGDDLREALPTRADNALNYLVVSFDALRADALGCYDADRPTSPNIDAFAAESLVFENAYSAAPVTPTSFAAAWSGMYPSRVFKNWTYTPEKTLAELFKEGGYKTYAALSNAQLTVKQNFHRGWDHYGYDEKATDEELLSRTTTWLDENHDEPFFAWCHFINPHTPYDYREMAKQFYDDDYRGPFFRKAAGSFYKFVRKDEEGKRADTIRLRELYDGEVFYCDDLFKRLLAHVEGLGLLENTVIVITADHGEEFLEHGDFQHVHLTDETTKVPLIVRHPEQTDGGRTESLYCNVDLLPTLASVAGLPVPGNLDGRDVRDPSTRSNRVVTIAMTDKNYRAIAIRERMAKMIMEIQPTTKSKLYDLAQDPAELQNLAATPAGEGATSAFGLQVIEILGGDLKMLMNLNAGDQTEGMDPATLARMKELGYIE